MPPPLKRQTIKVTEEEKKFFDNITYDQISEMKDLKKMHKLEQYMRQEHFPTTADYVLQRIVALGGTPQDPDHPMNRKVAEEDLKSFREELTSWETNMRLNEQEMADSKRCQNGKPAGPPIRSNLAGGTQSSKPAPAPKSAKAIEGSEAQRIQSQPGDVRSGRNYYDEWDHYATEENTRLDAEAKASDEVVKKKQTQGGAEEDDTPLEDDGGSGIAKQLRAMKNLSPSEKQWQATREKEKGNECFRSKEYIACVNHYSLSLKLHPGVAAVHTNRAAAYLKLKRWEDAETDCTFALELEPDNFKALMRRGAARIEMESEGAIEGAVEDIEEALKKEPENKELKSLHEKATRKVRHFIDRTEAKKMTRCVIEEMDDSDEEEEADDPAPPTIEEAGEKKKRVLIEEDSDEDEDDDDDDDDDDAADLLRSKTGAAPTPPTPEPVVEKTNVELAEEAKNEGNDWFKQGNYAKAEQCYNRSLELHPAMVPVLSNRAMCRIKLGKFAEAEVDADLALAFDPTFVKGFHRRGAARVGLGKKQEALDDYKEVLKVMPDTPGLKAEINALQEQLDDANYVPPRSGKMIIEVEDSDDEEEDNTEEQKKAAEKAAAEAKKKKELEAAVKDAEKKRLEAEKLAAEQAAKIEKAKQEREKHLKEIAEAREKVKKAEAATKKKLAEVNEQKQQVDEEQATKLKEQGNDAFKRGKFDEAVSLFSKSLKIQPKSAAVLGNRSAAYLKLEKFDLAAADASATLKLEPENVKAFHRRGAALKAQGKLKEALEDFNTVLKHIPNNKQVLADIKAVTEELSKSELPAVLSDPFYVATKFVGAREGYYFGKGSKGLGYYSDGNGKPKAAVKKETPKPAPTPAKQAPPPTPKAEERKRIVIEDDSSDEEDEEDSAPPPTPAAKKAPEPPTPATDRKRIVIEEEDSDEDEEEQVPSTTSTSAPPATPASDGTRRRIQIEDDDDEDDDEEEDDSAAKQAEAERLKTEGNTHFKKGLLKESIDAYTRSLAVWAENAPVYSNRAAAYMKMGKNKEAEADADKAVEIDPSYVKAHHRRGAARRALGKFEEALKDLEHVKEQLPGNKQVQEEIKEVKKQIAARVMTSASAPTSVPNPVTAKAAPPTTTPAPAPPAAENQSENKSPNQVSPQEREVKAAAAAAAVASKYLSRLPVPKSAAEFERSAKALAKDTAGLGGYIKQIEPEQYAKLFKDSINAPILNAFLSALHDVYLPDGLVSEATTCLTALSKVGRFSMAAMLLPKKDKQVLGDLFNKLASAGQDVAALRKLYKA